MNKDQCTGCQRCIKRCRRQVFDTVIDEGKICTVVKHPEKCTACGDCLVVCKRKALSIVKRT